MSNQYSTRVRWDPSNLALDGVAPSQAGIRRGRRVSSIGCKFIAGPVDVVWLSQARKLGVTALWVGLGLWFLRGLRHSNSFAVSNLMMREWGVQPDAKSRALRALEQAGLIIIERREKRSPRVTLVVGNRAGKDAWKEFNRQGAARVRADSV
jgi:DNA-binding transcriptional ArsR family regulator